MKEIAKFNQASTIAEFAEEITKSSPEQRRNLLKSYYTHVHPNISPVFEGEKVTSTPKSSTKKGRDSEVEMVCVIFVLI